MKINPSQCRSDSCVPAFPKREHDYSLFFVPKGYHKSCKCSQFKMY